MGTRTKRPPKGDEAMVKTTLRLSAETWRKARVRALDERVSFQALVEQAILDYLKGGRS
jgi:predicted HicB family RNase H-like nuclease